MSGPARVVHTVSGLKTIAGGVARSVPGLCEALARRGFSTSLLTQDPVGRAAGDLRLPDEGLVDVHRLRGVDFERWRFSYTPGIAAELARICARRPTVIHDHGIWLHMNHAVAAAARRMRVPRVVSPRGMLEGWSLRYRGWRKRAAWLAYQQRDLASATAFCATSDDEARSIREAGFAQPIAVLPNGVDVPAARADFAPDGPRTALFLSRLHPKKGLPDLVDAWAEVRPRGWRLVIAGNDEDGHAQSVERAIREKGCADCIAIAGPVEGAAKQRLIQGAQLFVLPSYSENFGIVVAEALAHGVPAIATRATPWGMLEREHCGWWIETGAPALARALREATALDAERLRDMGERGRSAVAGTLSWDGIARRHVAFYEWLLGRGPRPDFVV